MKLKIIEKFWWVDTRSGGLLRFIRLIFSIGAKKTTGKAVVACKVGEIPPFGKGNRKFFIDSVDSDSVTVSVCYDNPERNKSFVITKNHLVFYRPRSFDAGYQYTLKLV